MCRMWKSAPGSAKTRIDVKAEIGRKKVTRKTGHVRNESRGQGW